MAGRKPHTAVVKRLLLVQLLVAILFPLVLLPFGTNAALSAAAGGLASLIPNLYFAYRAFQYSGARSAQKILRSFYAGEGVKLVLTAFIFALCFIYLETLNAAALFGGFIMVQLAIWVTPWLANR